MKKKIILSTGGTGGHVFPMMGLYDYLVSKNYDVAFVSDQRAKKYFSEEMKSKITIFNINSPFNKKGFFKILSFVNLFIATIYSFFFLIKNRPKVIIGCGGYASFPMLMAGYILKINTVIYETNSILGRTNKFFYPFCKKLLLGFDKVKDLPYQYQKKAIYVGQLLRKSFNHKISKSPDKKNDFIILVLGGSQAAEFFGSNLARLFSDINKNTLSIRVFHQCKKEQMDSTRKAYGNFFNYELFDFKSNIEQLMAKADLAIVRSGASTISELAAINLPFVAIPLPSSLDNHQYHNAKYFEDKGCCWLVEQKLFEAESFKKLIADIVSNDKEKLKEKVKNMKNLNQTNVLSNFEQEIINYF